MGHHLFHTVLVANRGEIAVRVIRTLRALGIRSVAVHSESDAGALHVREADLALCIGPGPATLSYLDIDAVVDACVRSGAQAVHPGYGFLSENAAFARRLQAAGIVFIGPGAEALELMGDKIRAKNHVASHGVPVVPGVAEPGMDDASLAAAAGRVGFPLLIKPSAGGGGKGMHAVERAEDLPAALASARRVARNAFGDDTLLLERLVRSPRHIEVQVLADGFGHTIHLGERECSLQRRHQKVVEEAPSPLLEGLADGAETRARIGAAAIDAAKSVGYVGAGTVEFLVSDEDPDEFFFMEMNTRLQVEHPVTEEVVRIGPEGRRMDLVEWQVRIAAGEALEVTQSDVVLRGHAVEARVYAEDPADGFLPSIGSIFHYREPAGSGIRVDAMLAGEAEIGPHYDPMIAKIVASGAGRGQAMARLDAALAGTVVLGVRTNLEYLRALLEDADVRAGRLDTTLIDRLGPLGGREMAPVELAAVAHRLLSASGDTPPPGAGRSPDGHRRAAGAWTADGWRVGGRRPRPLVLEVQGVAHEVLAWGGAPEGGGALDFEIDGGRYTVADLRGTDGFTVNGVSQHVTVRIDPADPDGRTAWLSSGGFGAEVSWLDRRELLHRKLAGVELEQGEADPAARAPMPGTVVSIAVSTGDHVEAGQLLLGVEAMKMEHPLTAGVSGTVTLHAALGDQVKKGQALATVHPDAASAPDVDPAHPIEGK